MGDILKCNDGEFLDFLERCFVYDPKRRMSPREALRHPWISQVHCQSNHHSFL